MGCCARLIAARPVKAERYHDGVPPEREWTERDVQQVLSPADGQGG
jgi:hypothetical protein